MASHYWSARETVWMTVHHTTALLRMLRAVCAGSNHERFVSPEGIYVGRIFV
jgi:hypothetical protein